MIGLRELLAGCLAHPSGRREDGRTWMKGEEVAGEWTARMPSDGSGLDASAGEGLAVTIKEGLGGRSMEGTARRMWTQGRMDFVGGPDATAWILADAVVLAYGRDVNDGWRRGREVELVPFGRPEGHDASRGMAALLARSGDPLPSAPPRPDSSRLRGLLAAVACTSRDPRLAGHRTLGLDAAVTDAREPRPWSAYLVGPNGGREELVAEDGTLMARLVGDVGFEGHVLAPAGRWRDRRSHRRATPLRLRVRRPFPAGRSSAWDAAAGVARTRGALALLGPWGVDAMDDGTGLARVPGVAQGARGDSSPASTPPR